MCQISRQKLISTRAAKGKNPFHPTGAGYERRKRVSPVEQYYLDTSSLLPYYRNESHSQTVQNFLCSLTTSVVISSLTEVEFASALSRLVRMEELDEAMAGRIDQAFAEDSKAGLFRRISFTTTHFNQARQWLSLRNTPLRTLDTLHLAISHHANLTLVTCDNILAQSAKKLGAACCYLPKTQGRI